MSLRLPKAQDENLAFFNCMAVMWALFMAHEEWIWHMFGMPLLAAILISLLAACSALTACLIFSRSKPWGLASFALNALAPIAMLAVLAPAVSVYNGFDVLMILVWLGGTGLNATLGWRSFRSQAPESTRDAPAH